KFEGNSLQRNICLVLCWAVQFLAAREYWPTPEAVAIFMAIFYLFCYNKLSFLNNKFFAFLGGISYSLYLVHENLGIKVLLFFDACKTNFFLNVILAIAFSLAVAYLITVLIERPAMGFIRASYKRKRISS